MRYVSARMNALMTQETGTEPVIVVGINWGLATDWYSTKGGRYGNMLIKGSINGVGTCSCEKRQDSFGSVSTIDVTFDDSDGDLKYVLDRVNMEKAPAGVFLAYEGMSPMDFCPLIIGKVAGPVGWREGTRELTLTIESDVDTREFGYAPTQADFKDLSPEVYGSPWPMIFGKVRHVPALRVRKRATGYLQNPIRLAGFIEVNQITQLSMIKAPIVISTVYDPEETDPAKRQVEVPNMIFVEGGETFPQDTEISIMIDTIIFRGKFTNNIFNVTQNHIPKYENVKIVKTKIRTNAATGKTPTKETEGEDHNVITVEDTKVSLMGCYLYFGDLFEPRKCIKQEGQRCVLDRAMMTFQRTRRRVDEGTITQVYGFPADGLTSEQQTGIMNFLKERAKRVGFVPSASGRLTAFIRHMQESEGNQFWSAPPETPVRVWEKEDPEIYIVSAVECKKVTGVYGKQTVRMADGKDKKVMVPLPKDYYEVQLQSNFQIGNSFVTGIILHTPLSEYKGAEWEDDIYVSAESTIGGNTIAFDLDTPWEDYDAGANVVDVLQFILANYTDYIIDTSSFENVRNKLEERPCNFAYFERRDALQVAQEIAWQAKCVLVTDSDVVSLRYLGGSPGAVMAFSNDDIELLSIEWGCTGTTQIITKCIGGYTDTYREIRPPSRENERHDKRIQRVVRSMLPSTERESSANKIVTFRENVDRFGLTTQDFDLYIWDREEFAQDTINFWGHRMSNSWRTIRFKTRMPAVRLQAFDPILLQITGAAGIGTIGIVEEMSFDLDSKDVVIKCWLPILAGRLSMDSGAWE